MVTGGEDGALRSVAFNVHAVRVAVEPETGVVRILQSVQSADAGTVMNPAQLRGQIEGGVAHPPGYPTWTMLAYTFAKLVPYGEPAWRVNLSSAV
mgnify:CR=1 FL=1